MDYGDWLEGGEAPAPAQNAAYAAEWPAEFLPDLARLEILHAWFVACASRGVRAAEILGTAKEFGLEAEVNLDCSLGLGDRPTHQWADWERQHLEDGCAAGSTLHLSQPFKFNRAHYPTAEYALKLLPGFDLEAAYARLNAWVERLRSMPAA